MQNAITPRTPQMPARPIPVAAQVSAPPTIGRNDILFALFRHKVMILWLTLLGLVAAVGVYFFYPPKYESDAKLLVRYVLDRRTVDSLDNPNNSTALGATTDSVINSEVEILTSWDLAVQVAEALGPERLLGSNQPGGREAAAKVIASGLTVTAHPGSSIIYVAYKSKTPELATAVLSELLSRYFVKHLEVHRSAGAFDFVSQQTDQVRARLTQTDDALKEAKAKLGITSLAEGTANLNTALARAENQLSTAEADLAEQQARVKEMHLTVPDPAPIGRAQQRTLSAAKSPSAGNEESGEEIPDSIVERYQDIVARLTDLRKSERDLLSKFAPGSVMVRSLRKQIDNLGDEKLSLQSKYPGLIGRSAAAVVANGQPAEPVTEAARLAGMQAKTEELRKKVRELRAQMNQLTELAPSIGDLERKKELEENNYKYFANTLERARVDEALDSTKIPNISAVQRPSPPMQVIDKRNKVLLGCSVAGLAAGIAIALLRELILNQTLKRPSELESHLQTPLLLSIPDVSTNGKATAGRTEASNGSGLVLRATKNVIAPWDPGHFIRRYCEAIRDRIGLYFELHQLTHKPKLVGVTSFSDGAGTSTISAGLAAALSETDEGKVLLVDVSLGPDHVHPFFKGKPAYSLTKALESGKTLDPAAENLYLAKVGQSSAGLAQLGLKKFFDLMPNMKASDFDYIIFDMPSLFSTSPTWGMSAFMDKLLLVVEAGKSNREAVKRSYAKLANERDNISIILNRTRSYIPKALDTES